MTRLRATIALVCVLTLSACEREARRYHEVPVTVAGGEGVRQTSLQPGQAQDLPKVESPFRENAFGISEGKRLFAQFNCVGCHAHGGGSIGPALMDDKWIYGAAPQQIYLSIVEGRANGMPAFGGRIPDREVWQIVAFVQSLSMQVPRDAATSRDDDMSTMKPELRLEQLPPVQTGDR